MAQSSKDLKDAAADARVDPRLALVVQAIVEIGGLTPRTYGICELSRSGMFLAFKDEGSTRTDLERNLVDPGTRCEIAFAATIKGEQEWVRVTAEIVRITRHGIGVRFSTRNPPQLSALKDLFMRVEREAPPRAYSSTEQDGRKGEAVREDPAKTDSWRDWQLIERD